jgi:hypothetical protein
MQEEMVQIKAKEAAISNRFRSWRSAAFHALPAGLLVPGLFTYWFAVADRYIVFLYDHDMGPLYPDTSPFSRVTGSRYWMAGLVASGCLMALYTAASWALARLTARYRPPAWWRVWAVCALVLIPGVLAITMTANQPTLPLRHAAQVTLATLIGVALAVSPGRLAAERPGELLWLAADGFGVALLSNLIHIEKVGRWLARGGTLWVRMMIVSLATGAALLLALTGLRTWFRRPIPSAGALLVAGACIAYLLLPLAHHVVGTDGYYYISDSDNFFAQSPAVQLIAWSVIGVLVLGVTWVRKRVASSRAGRTPQPAD